MEMRTCVKCGNKVSDKDATMWDTPVGYAARFICKECADEEECELDEYEERRTKEDE